MKNFLLIICSIVLSTGAFAQVAINPQVGMNFMTFSDPPEGVTHSANVGFSIGADARLGERFQIQPGVHWFQSSTATEVEGGDIETDVVHQYLKLKAMAAYNLIDGDALKLRINAGPAYDFLINVDDGDFVEKDDFNSGVFYIQGGVGVDFLFLSAEVGYMQGLTDTFAYENAPDSRTQGFYFTVGVVLGGGD